MIHQEAISLGHNQTELEVEPEKGLMKLNDLKGLRIHLPKLGTCKAQERTAIKAGGSLSPRPIMGGESQMPPNMH